MTEEHVHVGLWQTLLSNHSCHLLLTVYWQSLGIHFSLWNGDKSWSVSTSNDNPFLITRNGVVLGPNFRHIYKGDTWHIIFGKGFLKYSRSPAGDMEVCIECCLAGKWYLVMSQQWHVKCGREERRRTGAQKGMLSHWTSHPWSHFASGLFCERLNIFSSQWIWVALSLITEDTKWHFCRSYTTEKWTLGNSFILRCWYRDLSYFL